MAMITLVNKMLTAFHTYYLTARAWLVDVKYPASLSGYIVGKHQDTKFEILSDLYEAIVTACGESRSGCLPLV